MAATVPEFYRFVAEKGLSRDFLFRVTDISIQGGNIQQGELVLARAASVPGRIIEDKIANYSGHEFHLGGRAVYSQSDGYPIEFYCDESSTLRNNLEAMSRTTFDVSPDAAGAGGNYGIDQNASISLRQLNKQFQGISTITLQGASIREIGDIDYMIADGTGEIVSFTATFAYQFYKIGA
jgi:hypothetical protein